MIKTCSNVASLVKTWSREGRPKPVEASFASEGNLPKVDVYVLLKLVTMSCASGAADVDSSKKFQCLWSLWSRATPGEEEGKVILVILDKLVFGIDAICRLCEMEFRDVGGM